MRRVSCPHLAPSYGKKKRLETGKWCSLRRVTVEYWIYDIRGMTIMMPVNRKPNARHRTQTPFAKPSTSQPNGSISEVGWNHSLAASLSDVQNALEKDFWTDMRAMRRTGLLSEKESITLLEGNSVSVIPDHMSATSRPIFHFVRGRAVPRVLVIRRESGRVRRLGDLAI